MPWAGRSEGGGADDAHKEQCDAPKQDGHVVQCDFAAGFVPKFVQDEDHNAPAATALAASRDFAEAAVRSARRADSGGAGARRILLRQSKWQMGREHAGIATPLPGSERAASDRETGCTDFTENGIGFGCGRGKRAAANGTE